MSRKPRKTFVETMKLIVDIIKSMLPLGLTIYLILMIFIIVSIGFAKIILAVFAKQKFKYSNLLAFCIIGLIISIILKIFNFNFSQKPLEIIICLIINILAFIVFKFRRKIFRKQNKI